MDEAEARQRIHDLLLTGSAATQDVDRARTAGASGYVTKDQIAGDLVKAILDATAS